MIKRRLKTSYLAAFLTLIVIETFAVDEAIKAPYVGKSLIGRPCEGHKSGEGYGPFDYRLRGQLGRDFYKVEGAHFTPEVAALIKGHSGPIPADIDYTIDAVPNHHRALYAISTYSMRPEAKKKPPLVPIECYFQRAINYTPDDSNVYLLYGIYLHKIGRHELALENYEAAKKLAPIDPQVQYNLALLFIDLERFDEAKKLAKNLYSKNFPLQGLKNKLIRSGHWNDPH